MSNSLKFKGFKAAYTGFYKDQFLRSYPEFLYALYLDFVLKVRFVTEPFCLHSLNSPKRKIPDFGYMLPNDDTLYLVEIKSTTKETEDTLVLYATYRFIPDYKQIQINFITISSKTKRFWVNKIVSAIGKNTFIKLSEDFKKQRTNENRVYTGFTGAKNPNFGVVTTDEKKAKTKATKIANGTYDNSGNKNPNFGNHHSKEAKLRIGAKWSDPIKKLAMKRKGMLTHFSTMKDNDKIQLKSYLTEVLINKNSAPMPKFINIAYSVDVPKINELFGSIDQFFNEVKL